MNIAAMLKAVKPVLSSRRFPYEIRALRAWVELVLHLADDTDDAPSFIEASGVTPADYSILNLNERGS